MKTSSVAALALSALYERDSAFLEQKFQHLTAPNLKEIDSLLWQEEKRILNDQNTSAHDVKSTHVATNNGSGNSIHNIHVDNNQKDHNRVLAQAVLRRLIFQGLGKFQNLYSIEVVEDALASHALSQHLQEELIRRYYGENIRGNESTTVRPRTWKDALRQLEKLSSRSDLPAEQKIDKRKLWELILDHPMTAYEPFRCQHCGQIIVQDVFSTAEENANLGLSMLEPNGSELGIRGGWFRGRPYSSKTIFQLDCQNCGETSRWYRSGHPKMLLNPAMGWGRLCGEQEDLRLHLASYLGIPIRVCLPLDWDHVWTEFLLPKENISGNDGTVADQAWGVRDDSARNFAVRLEEGIGSWTGVLAISPDPDWCEDVTNEYLSSRTQIKGGRADDVHAAKMARYREVVNVARCDATGDSTQAKTVNGFVLKRANWSSIEVSATMKRACGEYGSKEWWNLVDEAN
ncbi:MAG: hypothetical protein SGBAC_004062 [Bacillariaceae sp.]